MNELAYGEQLVEAVRTDPLIGEFAADKLVYYPTTTRESSPRVGRITTLLENSTVFSDLSMDDFSSENDRAMVCGSMGLNTDLKKITVHTVGPKRFKNKPVSNQIISESIGLLSPIWHYVGVLVSGKSV